MQLYRGNRPRGHVWHLRICQPWCRRRESMLHQWNLKRFGWWGRLRSDRAFRLGQHDTEVAQSILVGLHYQLDRLGRVDHSRDWSPGNQALENPLYPDTHKPYRVLHLGYSGQHLAIQLLWTTSFWGCIVELSLLRQNSFQLGYVLRSLYAHFWQLFASLVNHCVLLVGINHRLHLRRLHPYVLLRQLCDHDDKDLGLPERLDTVFMIKASNM